MSAIGSVHSHVFVEPFSLRFPTGPNSEERDAGSHYQTPSTRRGARPGAPSRDADTAQTDLRYTAFGRPQRWPAVYAATENFGFAAALMISAFFASQFLPARVLTEREAEQLSSARPSSSGWRLSRS